MAPPTTINKRKRTQESPSPEPVPKKKGRMAPVPSMKQPEVIRVPDDEDPATFSINVRLHSKFDNFPPKLRSILTHGYKITTLSQMDTLHTHKPVKHTHNYTLSIGESASPSLVGNKMAFHTTTTPRTPHLSIANMQLLEAFVMKFGTSFSKGSFVELATEEGMGNKDLISLHAVRHGEVGWGFDAYGCLSLYSARREESVLRKVVYFVERMERAVKVEID